MELQNSRSYSPARHIKGYLYEVIAEDQKEVPNLLKGLFTSPKEAQKAIDGYNDKYEVSAVEKTKYHKRKEQKKAREELENG